MPASELSFALTDAYREHVLELRGTLEASTRLLWSRIPRDQPDLDRAYTLLLNAVVPVATASQAEAVRASNGYLGAFLASETGEDARVEVMPGPVGESRDGRTLREALASPLIGVKAALKQGKSLDRALDVGQTRMLRTLSLDLDHAAQVPLLEGIELDPRFTGWQRAVRGTCGACLGASTGPSGGLMFPRHPHCQCVAEPRVRGARDRFPRPTGEQLFAAMTASEQDDALGPEAAELVRTNTISLTDLVATSPQATSDDLLTQRPVSALN